MGEYALGWNAAIQHCAAIAERWRDENKAACARARKSRTAFGPDMADQLDGAAIECNAIAGEIRKLAIADTHPKDGDVKQAPLVSGGGAEGNRTK